jgi:two-component system response regulator YesN
MKILIIDDEFIVRMGLEKLIQDRLPWVSEIRQASDGTEALELLAAFRPDICIVDICMRQMGGIEFISAVRNLNYDIQYIVISGYSNFSYAQQLMELGCRKYLVKPVNHEALLTCMESLKDEILAARKQRDKLNEVEANKNEILRFRQEKLIEKLLGGIVLSSAGEALAEAELQWLLKPYQVIVLGADCETDHLLNALNCFMESLSCKHLVGRYDAGEAFVLLAQIPGAQAFAESLRASLALRLTMPCVAGMSRGEDNLNEALSNSRSAMQCAFSDHCEKLQVHGAYQAGAHFDADFHELQLRASIESSSESVSAAVDEMLESLNKARLSSRACSSYVSRMYLLAYTALVDVKHADFVTILPSVMAFETSLNGYHTFNRMQDYVKEIFSCISSLIARSSNAGEKRVIHDSKRFIEENYSRDISLGDIADYLKMNPSYFSYLFKQETGQTYINYLINLRIEKAKSLLLNSPLKIYQIGETVGYSDPKYFNRIFHQVTGLTPGAFRDGKKE